MSGPAAGGVAGPAHAAIRRIAGLLTFLAPLAVLAALWQAVPASGLVDPNLLPPVTAVIRAIGELARTGSFWLDLGTTALRALVGLVLGAAVGIAIGAGMAVSPGARGFFDPLVKATYSLPKTALIPLLILWLGIGTATNVVAVMLSCLLPLVVYTYHGVLAAPRILVWSALAMGTGPRALFRLVLLPSAMGEVLAGLRIALGFAFVIAISAEMIASNVGIGKLLFLYGENGAYAHMFAAVLAIVAVAFAADATLLALARHLLRWQDNPARFA